VLSPLPGLRIAVVYGRRRQGKSYLLRRLAGAVGGLYHLATEQAEPVSPRRFGDSLATWAGLPAGSFGFGDWELALRTATEVLAARARSGASPQVPALLVLDEFPYLSQETPGLPSIVQSLYDSRGPGAGAGAEPLRLVLCGSAISVMADPLSGTKALRGRAALELCVRPFGYRDAREHWEIETPAAALLTTPSSEARPATGSSCPPSRRPGGRMGVCEKSRRRRGQAWNGASSWPEASRWGRPSNGRSESWTPCPRPAISSSSTRAAERDAPPTA
jgi:hypothetical protein